MVSGVNSLSSRRHRLGLGKGLGCGKSGYGAGRRTARLFLRRFSSFLGIFRRVKPGR